MKTRDQDLEPGQPTPNRAETGAPQIIQRDAAELAAGYSKGFRVIEILGILTFLGLSGALIYRVSGFASGSWLICASAAFAGLLAADFMSGLVHWAGDTWGSPDWPVIGKTFIRPFREHHVDEKAITRHDFIEINGANCIVSIPFLIAALLIPLGEPGAPNHLGLFASIGFTSMLLFIFGTNQFHKWAHEDQPSALARLLQRTHLVLTPENHAVHHRAPYEHHYCITNGWLNAPLKRIGFYRKAEALIHLVTGAIPRRDDIGVSAAVEILKEATPLVNPTNRIGRLPASEPTA